MIGFFFLGQHLQGVGPTVTTDCLSHCRYQNLLLHTCLTGKPTIKSPKVPSSPKLTSPTAAETHPDSKPASRMSRPEREHNAPSRYTTVAHVDATRVTGQRERPLLPPGVGFVAASCNGGTWRQDPFASPVVLRSVHDACRLRKRKSWTDGGAMRMYVWGHGGIS